MTLLVCFTLTVFVDMVAGVGVGMICAAFLLIKRVTELTKIEVEGKMGVAGEPSRALPDGVMLYRIRGPLFFGTIEKAFDRYYFAHDYVTKLVLDVTDVPFIDMTGLVAMKSMLSSIAHEKRQVYIVSNAPEVTDRIKRKIADLHVRDFVHFHVSVEEVLSGNV